MTTLLLVFFLMIFKQHFAQQVYLFQGKIVSVDSLLFHYETADAINELDQLAKQPNKQFSAKEKRQYQLEIDLLKA